MNLRIPIALVAKLVARVAPIRRGDQIVALSIDPTRAELRLRAWSGAVTTLRVESKSQRRWFAVLAALVYVKPGDRPRAYLRTSGVPYAVDMLLNLDRRSPVLRSASASFHAPRAPARRAH
jgi:hypothetical protein